MSTHAQPTGQRTRQQHAEGRPREELCGQHLGDRRVRVARQPRTASEKITSILRRALNR